jgi:hypothetical protein
MVDRATDLRPRRQRERPGEFAGASLAERKSLYLLLSRLFRLSRYAKDVVMNVDGHVLLVNAREID